MTSGTDDLGVPLAARGWGGKGAQVATDGVVCVFACVFVQQSII